MRRGGRDLTYTPCARMVLDSFAEERKNYVTLQYLAFQRRFQRSSCPGADEATANEAALQEFDMRWSEHDMRLSMVPGKDAMSRLNEYMQQTYGVTVTPTAIVDSMRIDEMPEEIQDLIASLNSFADLRPGAQKG